MSPPEPRQKKIRARIEPLEASVEIKRGASDEDVTSILKKAGKLEDMAKPVSPIIH